MSKFSDSIYPNVISQVPKSALICKDLNIFLEIKFATKVARIMAFTLTKMRDQIIGHVNRQADKIQSFKEDMINKLVTYDCLQVKLKIRNIFSTHTVEYLKSSSTSSSQVSTNLQIQVPICRNFKWWAHQPSWSNYLSHLNGKPVINFIKELKR